MAHVTITHVAHVIDSHVAHVTITHVAHVTITHAAHVTITHVAHVTDPCPAIIAIQRRGYASLSAAAQAPPSAYPSHYVQLAKLTGAFN